MDKLHMKFSALNVDFNGPSLDFLGSRKPVHEGVKEWYPCTSCYFSDVGQSQSFVKTVADKHGHAIDFRASRKISLNFLFYLATFFWKVSPLSKTRGLVLHNFTSFCHSTNSIRE